MKKLLPLLWLASLPVWAYEVTITEPSVERAYSSPAETLQIKTSISPEPTALHTFVIKLDDKVLAINEDNASIATMGQNTGEHTITAELQDETGRVIASDVRKVYFVINTIIMREKREFAKAQDAYNALPWYKKLMTSPPKQPVQPSGLVSPQVGITGPTVGLPE